MFFFPTKMSFKFIRYISCLVQWILNINSFLFFSYSLCFILIVAWLFDTARRLDHIAGIYILIFPFVNYNIIKYFLFTAIIFLKVILIRLSKLLRSLAKKSSDYYLKRKEYFLRTKYRIEYGWYLEHLQVSANGLYVF